MWKCALLKSKKNTTKNCKLILSETVETIAHDTILFLKTLYTIYK